MRTRFTAASCGVSALVATACVLTGCSTSNTGNGETSGNSLSISWKNEEKAGIDAVVAAFKKAHPDAKIVITAEPTEQYQAALRTQLSAGSAADVFFMWPGNGNPGAMRQIVPGGFAQDLSSQSWTKDYPAAISQLTAVNGKTYLMAPSVTSFGPWYNEAALAGAKLTAPTSWSDVIPFCKAARSQGKTAYAIGAATLNTTQNTLYNLVPDLAYGADPDFDKQLADGSTTFAGNKGWITAMDQYKEMIDAGCFNDDPTGLPQDGQNKLVASGKALGMAGIGSQVGALKQLNPKGTFRLHPLSGDDNPGTNLMTVSNAGGAAVNAHAKNKKLALEFVDFLAKPQSLQAYSDALSGAVPSIPTGARAEDPNLKLITDYLTKKQTVHFLNQDWPNAQTEQAMYSGVQGMLSGDGTPGDVLKAMDDAYGDKH